MKIKISRLFLLFAIFLGAMLQAQTPPPPPPPRLIDTLTTTQRVGKGADTNEVYQFAEKPAQFPGGESAFFSYLQENIHYPTIEKESNKQGTVYINFVVEKDGSISNVTCVKGVPDAPGLAKEASRVIAAMPKWTPGEIGGKPVRLSITQPVKFKLTEKVEQPPICGKPFRVDQMGAAIDFNPGRMPEFPGGDSAMQAFVRTEMLKNKKDYPAISGKTVQLVFVVDKNGLVCDVHSASGETADPKLLLIAGTILCDMPSWTPGGWGKYIKNSAGNTNMRLSASFFLGEYKGKKIKKEPALTVQPLRADGQKMNVPVSEQPQFPGGDTALAAFLKKNLVYPAAEKAAGKSGTVIIGFVVEADGSISFPGPMQEVDGAPGLTQEAMRLVKLMPRWQAGKSNGIPTRMLVKLPVEFKL